MRWIIIGTVILLLTFVGIFGFIFFWQPTSQGDNQNLSSSIIDPFGTSYSENTPSNGNVGLSVSGGTVVGRGGNVQNQAQEKVRSYALEHETPFVVGIGNVYPIGESEHATSSMYGIFYVEEEDMVHIILNEEPIGQARRQAQDALLRFVLLSEGEACTLNYRVVTSVNEHYAAQSLGFSFCPNSVVLSEI